jgi:4'-phosphopantetheinyl transferase
VTVVLCERAAGGAVPELQPGDTHVWWATTDIDQELMSELEATLAKDEQKRAKSFLFVRDQKRWIVTRGLLRFLLGNYTSQTASSLRFEYGPDGKPHLAGSHKVGFSLSRSQRLCVYALSADEHIGIDVEAIRPGMEREEVARQYCTSDELRRLRSLPPSQQSAAFLSCWTAKEACAKAAWKGVQLSFHTFSVDVDGKRSRCRVDGTTYELIGLQLTPGYVAAYAIPQSGLPSQSRLRVRHHPTAYPFASMSVMSFRETV